MLGCTNLGCRRGGKRLFSGLGITLMPGCLLLVRGANGSGKTTLIKILSGTLKPERGQTEWDGDVIEQSAGFLHQLIYISHANAIKPHLTVEENLQFWATLTGESMLLPAAAHFWGLDDKLDIPCNRLSAGWQRRVALARLLLAPRALWLLDEPATHLDEEGVNMLNSAIASRCRQGGIVVMSSHGITGFTNALTLHLEDFTG